MFYSYHQNNSGGFFCSPAIDVVIEADSAEEANRIAESKGLYFDGQGDCDCCGNRWTEEFGSGEDSVPELYKESWYDSKVNYKVKRRIVYFKDGTTGQ